jgi:hypothetical protein
LPFLFLSLVRFDDSRILALLDQREPQLGFLTCLRKRQRGRTATVEAEPSATWATANARIQNEGDPASLPGEPVNVGRHPSAKSRQLRVVDLVSLARLGRR